MKKSVSVILLITIIASFIPATLSFAAERKDVEPFFSLNDKPGGGSLDMAVKNDGTLWIGSSYYNEMELYEENVRKAYFDTTGEKYLDVKTIYIIKKDNSLWKINDYHGNARTDTKEKLMDDVADFLTLNDEGFYALKTDGTLWCWGKGGSEIPGTRGPLSEGGSVSISLSNAIRLADDVRTFGHGYLVKNDDTLWVWGWRQIPGTDKAATYEYPVKIMEDVKTLFNYNYIIKTDNSLWSWNGGYKGDNKLGTKILDNVKKVGYNVALTRDGTVYIWDRINTKTFPMCPEASATPVKVAENIRDIYGSSSELMMLKNNGELWYYGYHQKGIDGTTGVYDPYKLMNLCSLSLTGESSLLIGKETPITATYYDENGYPVYDGNISWYCEDTDKVSFTPSGNTITLRGLSEGTVTITAVHNPTGETATFELDIIRYKTDLLPTYNIVKGDSKEIEYCVLKNTTPVISSDITVNWSIENNVNAEYPGTNTAKVQYDRYDSGTERKLKIDASHKGSCTLVGKFDDTEIARINLNIIGDIKEVVEDEMMLRAKVLLSSNRFEYYLNHYKSPAKIMTELMWTKPAEFYSSAGQLFKDSDSRTNYYEIVLLALLLDDKQLNYDIEEILKGKIDTSVIASLNTILGVELTDLKTAAKEIPAIKNADDFKAAFGDLGKTLTKNADDLINFKSNIGFGDAIGALLTAYEAENVTMEAFSEMVALGTVSNYKTEVLQKLENYTTDKDFKKAYKKVQEKYIAGNNECSLQMYSKALESGGAVNEAFIRETAFNAILGKSWLSLYKIGFDAGMAIANFGFSSDKLSNRILTMGAYSTVEDILQDALKDAKESFDSNPNPDTASEFVTLADLYKICLLKSCDEAADFVDEGKNANSKMNQRVFGDFTPDSAFSLFEKPDYQSVKDTITRTKQIILNSNFYESDIDIAAYISEPRSFTPSGWAKADIDKAIRYELIPDYMQHNYQENITRAEFCTLITRLVEATSGKDIDVFIEENGVAIKSPFADTYYQYVDYIYKLGIVNGVGSDMFDPLGNITREQAATMLKRTAEIFGKTDISVSDIEPGVAQWAKDGVTYVLSTGIMRGTNNGFSPQGTYTKEQAITTFVRMFEYIKNQ